MNLTEKQAAVETWKEMFDSATSLVLCDYSGLKANQINDLRRECHEANVNFQVVKNTLAKRAIEGSANEFLADSFKGTIAVAFGIEDQVAPAKVLAKAAKDYDSFELIAGALDGKPLDAAGVQTLSKMPGRDELRGQLLGLFDAVPGGFVRLLNAVPGGMVNVLDARKRDLEEAA